MFFKPEIDLLNLYSSDCLKSQFVSAEKNLRIQIELLTYFSTSDENCG